MKIVLCAVIGFVIAGCTPASHWQKGNLHTHTLWSDGNDFPEMVALWYRDHGYQFLALSDHNVLSRGQRWMKVSEVEKRGGKAAIEKYLQRMGDSSVEFRGEGADREIRLKNLDEIRHVAQTADFIMIEGEEITDHFQSKPVHMNATNLAEFVEPQGGSDVRDVMRRNLIAVQEQASKLRRAILVHLNHPNFGYAVTAEDIAHVVEEEFFEVYNGHPGVNHNGDAQHASVERMWDIANTIRIADLQAAPLYGVATDDSHHYHDGTKGASPGRGWIMVKARKREAEPIIHAMRRGDFYASSGVVLKSVRFHSGKLTIEIDPTDDAEYTIDFVGTLEGYDSRSQEQTDAKGNQLTRQYSSQVGQVLKSMKGLKAEYQMTGQELYVRAVITSNKAPENPSSADQKAQAWTQPVGWEKRVATHEKTTPAHKH